MGYLRSVAPILGWERYRLGSITKAQSALGQVDWEAEGSDLEPKDPAIRVMLAAAIAEAKSRILAISETPPPPRHNASHISLLRKARDSVAYIAVDSTLERYSVYAYDTNGRVTILEDEPFRDERKAVCSIPTLTSVRPMR